MRELLLSVALSFASLLLTAQQQISATIDFTSTHDVSPLIFGYNQNHENPSGIENWGSRRLGGNRLSTTNWENNASNCGHDCANYSNDNRIPNLLGVPSDDANTPGEAYRSFHQENLDAGVTSILTLPMMGWVAADKDGANTTTPPGARWVEVVYEKPGPFSLTPDLNDGVMYLDEAMNFLVQSFGDAKTATGVKYIALDNEPALWESTHPYIFTSPEVIDDYIVKCIAGAKAVKSVDPDVQIIMGEFAGINLYDFNGGTDWSTKSAGYDWFVDYFLEELKSASDAAGYPLIDILSFHNYPQHKIDQNGDFSGSGTGVRSSNSTDELIRQTRMDFPRSMWDPSYIEPSWLTSSKLGGEANRILDRVQNSIKTYFPGVKIMIGEWDYGFDSDISHGVATADALGVFTNYDVEIANRWDLNTFNTPNYSSSAFQLFRNYDGLNGTIGDQGLASSFTNPQYGSVWGTQDSDDNQVHLILVSKTQTENTVFEITLSNGGGNYEIDGVFGFDGASTNLMQPPHDGAINGSTLTITLPPLSVYHVVINQDGVVCQTPNLGADQTLCTNTTALLETGVTDAHALFAWSKDGVSFSGGASVETSTTGDFEVTVSIDGCTDKTATVSVFSELISVQKDTVCKMGDKANLVISAPGSYAWYDRANGGSLLSSSAVFEPTVNNDSTFFVEDQNAETFTLGKTVQDGTRWGNNADGAYELWGRSMEMTIETDLTLNSVDVYINALTDVVLNLNNGAGFSQSFSFDGLSAGIHTLYLNASLAPGMYSVDFVGTVGGVDLQVDNYASISEPSVFQLESTDQPGVHYGFFYNVTLSVGTVCARTPVEVRVDPSASKCIITSNHFHLPEELQLFPNPVLETLHFSRAVAFQVTDLRGNVLLKGVGDTLDVSTLLPGLYLVSFEGKHFKIRKR